jgi:hypothetical protein
MSRGESVSFGILGQTGLDRIRVDIVDEVGKVTLVSYCAGVEAGLPDGP